MLTYSSQICLREATSELFMVHFFHASQYQIYFAYIFCKRTQTYLNLSNFKNVDKPMFL